MNQKIVVRKIQHGEDKAVWKVAKTQGILARYSFYLLYLIGKANALIAVNRERIVVGNQICTFPVGFIFKANSSVKIVTGPSATGDGINSLR